MLCRLAHIRKSETRMTSNSSVLKQVPKTHKQTKNPKTQKLGQVIMPDFVLLYVIMTKHNVQILGVSPFFKSSTNQHLAVKLWKMRCRTPKQHNILASWHNHLKANKCPASHFLPVVDSCNLVFYAQSTSVSGQVVDRYQARSFHFTMPYFVLLADTSPSPSTLSCLCVVDRYQAK